MAQPCGSPRRTLRHVQPHGLVVLLSSRLRSEDDAALPPSIARLARVGRLRIFTTARLALPLTARALRRLHARLDDEQPRHRRALLSSGLPLPLHHVGRSTRPTSATARASCARRRRRRSRTWLVCV